MTVHPRQVQPSIDFQDESPAEALARYDGFGWSVFEGLWDVHPFLRDGFQFFRDPRTDDLWSYCSVAPRDFGLQLDPDIEVICLWDGAGGTEIGSWAADPESAAIEWIATAACSLSNASSDGDGQTQ